MLLRIYLEIKNAKPGNLFDMDSELGPRKDNAEHGIGLKTTLKKKKKKATEKNSDVSEACLLAGSR